jgi:DMSO/TMAO reductase YedYZ molybdopterin-dependent catalytic subunit
VLTQTWPVLTYGETPRVDLATWRFRCFGLVEEEVSWTWEELLALPRVEVVSDIHCVTRWSRFDNRWEGVSTREALRRARPLPSAVAALVHTVEGYTTNLTLEELGAEDALLAIKHDGKDLEPEHGGPCRLVVPRLYLWKSAKWVSSFELLSVDTPGFWEENGYHLHADPFKEERYSDQETRAMQEMRAEAARRRRGRQE